ncbi:MAG: biotin/lipoyl-binding protein [Fimbriimonadaceae bacterium]|nr:biotin/lipoyl-binding protein [Fimbriimonadaceae bacterium]
MKVLVDGVEFDLVESGATIRQDGDRLRVQTPEGARTAVVVRQGDKTYVSVGGRVYEVEKFSATRKASGGVSSGEGRAPMPGMIVEVLVKTGDKVAKGDQLLILEAMKMQQPVTAGIDGIVSELNVAKGDQVTDGQLLVKVTAPGE